MHINRSKTVPFQLRFQLWEQKIVEKTEIWWVKRWLSPEPFSSLRTGCWSLRNEQVNCRTTKRSIFLKIRPSTYNSFTEAVQNTLVKRFINCTYLKNKFSMHNSFKIKKRTINIFSSFDFWNRNCCGLQEFSTTHSARRHFVSRVISETLQTHHKWLLTF